MFLPRRFLLASLLTPVCGLHLVAYCKSKTSSSAGRAAGARTMASLDKPPGTVRLLLTGDVMLGRGVDQILPYHCHPRIYESCVQDARVYVELAERANGPLPPGDVGPDYPWGIALEDMAERSPDVRLVNLETAVTTHDRPWPRKGINYHTHPGNVATLAAAGIQVASLANNHSLDWCTPGLLESLEALAGAGIQVVGAGRNAEEAQRPAIVSVTSTQHPHQQQQQAEAHLPAKEAAATAAALEAAAPGEAAAAGAAAAVGSSGAGSEGGTAPSSSSRVLIWALGHESSGVPEEWEAEEGQPGIFITDLSARDVERLGAMVAAEKRPGDVVVVSVHWGGNWGFDIPKEQRWFARTLIDQAGVDVVHGHSSHHAKGCEVYKGKLIIYGAGDLISDYEGIRNDTVETYFPPEQYRDDVGLLWYADVSAADGTLRQLAMRPTRLRHLRLEHPDPADWRYIERTMDKECRKLGRGLGVHQEPGASALLLDLPPREEEE